jgi:hypothetical protein
MPLDGETVLLIFLLFTLFVLYLSKTHCRPLEKYTNVGSCDCYEEHNNFADGMCWKKDFDGHYLRDPKMVCAPQSDPKCGCWAKHIQYHGGFCYDPGHRYGVRPPCTVSK